MSTPSTDATPALCAAALRPETQAVRVVGRRRQSASCRKQSANDCALLPPLASPDGLRKQAEPGSRPRGGALGSPFEPVAAQHIAEKIAPLNRRLGSCPWQWYRRRRTTATDATPALCAIALRPGTQLMGWWVAADSPHVAENTLPTTVHYSPRLPPRTACGSRPSRGRVQRAGHTDHQANPSPRSRSPTLRAQ
jgi:hypothetical protein